MNKADQQSNPEAEKIPDSGNIWGTNFSIFSFFVILVTLIIVLIFGEGPHATNKIEPMQNPYIKALDTLEQNKDKEQ